LIAYDSSGGSYHLTLGEVGKGTGEVNWGATAHADTTTGTVFQGGYPDVGQGLRPPGSAGPFPFTVDKIGALAKTPAFLDLVHAMKAGKVGF
jgi:hypothetical protein